MTAPRQVFAGDYYLVTRRCTQREFLLRPSEYVNEAYLYCLGEAALRFNVSPVAWVPMSNHHHMVVRDNDGKLPEFLAHLHKMLAKVLNVHWGRSENLWATEQVSVVRLAMPEDILAKIIYTLVNPVADHLVARADEWPGATSLRLNLTGDAIVARRPAFFRADGPMPSQVTLRAVRPTAYEDLSQEEWAKLLRKEIDEHEKRARSERRKKGITVLGAKAVLAARHTQRAKKPDPQDAGKPVLACQHPELRRYLLAEVLAFRSAYRHAWNAWAAGHKDVVFPAGTYAMVVHGVKRSPPRLLKIREHHPLLAT